MSVPHMFSDEGEPVGSPMCSYDRDVGERERGDEDMTWIGVGIFLGQVMLFIVIAAALVGLVLWIVDSFQWP